MKPEPRIVDSLNSGTDVKINCGVGEDGEVYLLDAKGRPVSDGQDGYRIVSPRIAEEIKAAIKRTDDVAKKLKADFIRPDPASIPQNEEED